MSLFRAENHWGKPRDIFVGNSSIGCKIEIWIPAFAGMTGAGAGVTGKSAPVSSTGQALWTAWAPAFAGDSGVGTE